MDENNELPQDQARQGSALSPMRAPGLRLTTCETVVTDTPARRATSFMVARDSPSGRLRTGPHPFVEPLSRP